MTEGLECRDEQGVRRGPGVSVERTAFAPRGQPVAGDVTAVEAQMAGDTAGAV